MNGIPNLSVLDGWWKEGYDGANGWALPLGPEGLDDRAKDDHDAEALYRILEQEVVPLFYTRDPDGIPHGGVTIVKNAVPAVPGRADSQRMAVRSTS